MKLFLALGFVLGSVAFAEGTATTAAPAATTAPAHEAVAAETPAACKMDMEKHCMGKMGDEALACLKTHATGACKAALGGGKKATKKKHG